MRGWRAAILCALIGVYVPPALASSAPKWMQALSSVTLPAQDEKTSAVVLYSDISVTVQSSGKIDVLERRALKILRPEGEVRGKLIFTLSSQTRVTDLHAWSIPAVGKDYEVNKKDAIEAGFPGVQNGILVSDVRALLLQIPAATPGSIIGYEVEQEMTPYVLSEIWRFQDTIPVREAHYGLKLPSGWSYHATWLNHADENPAALGANNWTWTLTDVPAIRLEADMPPWTGVAASMYLALIGPSSRGRSVQTWNDVGLWYLDLASGRRAASPQLKQEVVDLTASLPSLEAKIQAVARFVQQDVRYVGIELGIGGYQPHSAAEVFAHQYGDCKDKANLLSTMLDQIDVSSYFVIINAARGAVEAGSPPIPFNFNHAILAIALPPDVDDARLEATIKHDRLGKLLFFDPTNPITPFGSIAGQLQGNYGLLVAPTGSDLVKLPQLPPSASGVARTAQFTVDDSGTMRGDVTEVRSGDNGARARFALGNAKADTDEIKPLEALLSASLSSYSISKAAIRNRQAVDRPLEWRYSIEVSRYARMAGDLLLIRPRVLGIQTRGIMEAKEPRLQPVEFEGPVHDTDTFEIAMPPGYEIDSLPAPVDIDEGFASYHSKTQMSGHTLTYSRVFEITKLSVPVDQAPELRSFYRKIDADERGEAVLKHSAHYAH
jgi:Domain of Unknown Function with PDB structure (DUF3857)